MAIKSFEECLSILERLVPRNLKSNNDFNVLLKLIAYSMSKNYEGLDRLDNAYSVDFVDVRDLPKLADTLGIVCPVGADTDKLRLLLKYYGNIIKSRGTLDSIKQMARILEFSENDLYLMSLENYSDIDIRVIEDYFILIRFDGITDFDYAYRMLRKVVPAGYRYEVSNKNGPVVKSFEKYLFSEDSYNIEVYYDKSDSITASESVLIEQL